LSSNAENLNSDSRANIRQMLNYKLSSTVGNMFKKNVKRQKLFKNQIEKTRSRKENKPKDLF
jgi:hypothetical protein